jgi:hypothetical protein
MLEWLRQQGKLSERKARLLAAAWCRGAWPQVTDERIKRIIEAAEQHAEEATADRQVSALEAAEILFPSMEPDAPLDHGRHQKADLVRELFSPFLAEPLDLAWRTPAIVSLAREIYDDRLFDVMPALGAALSDAGCTVPEILQHCSRGPHVRGCFVLDAVLGRS